MMNCACVDKSIQITLHVYNLNSLEDVEKNTEIEAIIYSL